MTQIEYFKVLYKQLEQSLHIPIYWVECSINNLKQDLYFDILGWVQQQSILLSLIKEV